MQEPGDFPVHSLPSTQHATACEFLQSYAKSLQNFKIDAGTVTCAVLAAEMYNNKRLKIAGQPGKLDIVKRCFVQKQIISKNIPQLIDENAIVNGGDAR